MQAGDRLMSHAAVVDYAEWEPGAFGPLSVLDGLPMPWAVARVEAAVRAAIAAEVPIHHDRLTKLVAGAFGLRRVGADRQQAISLAVPPVYQRRSRGAVLFGQSVSTPMRGAASVGRPRSEPSPGLGAAGGDCERDVRGRRIPQVGLTTRRSNAKHRPCFGGRRLTPAIEAGLNEAVQLALDSARITRSSVGVLVSSTRVTANGRCRVHFRNRARFVCAHEGGGPQNRGLGMRYFRAFVAVVGIVALQLGTLVSAAEVQAPSPTSTHLFTDDFLDRSLSSWVGGGLFVRDVIPDETVENPAWESYAGGTMTGQPAYLYHSLSFPTTRLFMSFFFSISNRGSASINFAKLRTSSGRAIAELYVTSGGRLGLRNDILGKATTSSVPIAPDHWYRASLGVVVTGTTSTTTVMIDGLTIPELTIITIWARIRWDASESARTWRAAPARWLSTPSRSCAQRRPPGRRDGVTGVQC